MNLTTKTVGLSLASMGVCVVVGLLVQRQVIREQGIELTRNTMRAAVIEAENVRETISRLNEREAFNRAQLLSQFRETGDLESSTLYQTIPVVAAWEAIEKVAEQEQFEFRVPKRQARNAKNNPTPDEEVILNLLESGETTEYFNVDPKRNEIVFARPIVLTKDCLACHGDPKDSPTGDGKDMVGFPMENWKAGEVHGAFVLKADLTRVDSVVRAGMGTTLFWVLPISALIGAGFYFLNRRIMVRPLSRAIVAIDTSSQQTAAASIQIASASQQLAEGASEQAASLEETSASLEEMTSMIKRNAEAAGQARELAGRARTSAENGRKEMAAMMTAMGELQSSSTDVAKIVKDIDEIAFQTNILALNAAVEAARAGEAGMGFAVVADEVRNLAQRCAHSAKETSSKIDVALERSERGAELSGRVAKNLGEIESQTSAVDELVGQIAAASSEQAQGIEQVNLAVSQMDRVVQCTAASAEECASAAEELSSQAESTSESVSRLTQLIGGNPKSRRTGDRADTSPAATPMVESWRPPHADRRNGRQSEIRKAEGSPRRPVRNQIAGSSANS